MANNNLNPLSRLLDIQFPDIKRSNWNTSYDFATTASVGYVNVVHTDHIMAGTRAKLDFNSASFANSTIAPLYGRYKVKYLAVWAPDRLYMSDWLTGEKMKDDDYPYPYLSPTWAISSPVDTGSNLTSGNFDEVARSSAGYIPPTSLGHQLRLYPAMTCSQTFAENDNIPNRNAFAFLTYWDAFRTFIANPQEPDFYVRTKAFIPEITRRSQGVAESTIPAQEPIDRRLTLDALDRFFKRVKRASVPLDIIPTWIEYFGYDPIWSRRYVYRYGPNGDVPISGNYDKRENVLIHHNYHYGLPVCTHKPDFFTSWVSNENVELEKSKSKVTAKGTVNGSDVTTEFTMEQWYLASRIQSKIRKNIYQFNDFAQWIDTNFGVKPPTTLTQPMFLGAFESDIIFNDVISQTQTGSASENNLGDNKDLGSRAGFGIGKNGNESNFFDFTAKEPGTVMILQMIVPEVFYFECSDPLHNTLNFNEEFNPVFDALGFQDLGKGDMNLVPNLANDPDGGFIGSRSPQDFSAYNIAIAQQPYAMEHMCKVNLLGGQMVEPTYYQNWTLARSFNYCRGDLFRPTIIPNQRNYYSTYILPENYQNIFASSPHVDNFQFYLSFNYTKYQPVGKQFLSFPVR